MAMGLFITTRLEKGLGSRLAISIACICRVISRSGRCISCETEGPNHAAILERGGSSEINYPLLISIKYITARIRMWSPTIVLTGRRVV